MISRVAVLSGIGFAGLVAGALALAVGLSGAGAVPERIAFVIATGSTGGSYFPIGQAIAGLISHPPGVTRCEQVGLCGPVGLIASARTSASAVADVEAVETGQVDSALAQSDVVAEGVAGTGAFAKLGPQSHVRAIAALFPQDVLVVVATASKVKTVSQLRGKRVSLGTADSGTLVTARAVFAAYRLPVWRIKARYLSADMAAQQMQKGDLDAFFFIGAAPSETVQGLVGRGIARLVAIDGTARNRLLAKVSALAADRIAAGAYGTGPAIDTVAVRAVWIVRDSQSPDLVFQITRALFDLANRKMLDESDPSARLIGLDTATQGLGAPLHAGAARFYRAVGKLPPLPEPTPRKM